MKTKGFTLIELIVVIAIIGILAAILVPSMLGYVRNARASRLNANARSIYSAAQLAITDYNGGLLLLIEPDCVYTGSDDGMAHPDSASAVDCDLTNYLGEKFDGYFAFMTDSGASGCLYAMWSEHPISAADVQQMTEREVKDSVRNGTSVGCHPLKRTVGDDT
ncbi:MAG: type II secretion system protein [Oscillospiraceae bacterium]|nr:type II secretion system protein [Oscillospiraceae bacterium]